MMEDADAKRCTTSHDMVTTKAGVKLKCKSMIFGVSSSAIVGLNIQASMVSGARDRASNLIYISQADIAANVCGCCVASFRFI